MKKMIYIFLLIVVNCKAQITSSTTNDNDYQKMKRVIGNYIKSTEYFKVLKENNVQPKFYITNLSSEKKETIKSDSLKEKISLKDGVYAFYIKDIRYSFTHIYVKYKGNMKIFESINCPSNNSKIERVIGYVKNNFYNNQIVIDDIYNYSKYIQYLKIDPQSKLDCP